MDFDNYDDGIIGMTNIPSELADVGNDGDQHFTLHNDQPSTSKDYRSPQNELSNNCKLLESPEQKKEKLKTNITKQDAAQKRYKNEIARKKKQSEKERMKQLRILKRQQSEINGKDKCEKHVTTFIEESFMNSVESCFCSEGRRLCVALDDLYKNDVNYQIAKDFKDGVSRLVYNKRRIVYSIEDSTDINEAAEIEPYIIHCIMLVEVVNLAKRAGSLVNYLHGLICELNIEPVITLVIMSPQRNTLSDSVFAALIECSMRFKAFTYHYLHSIKDVAETIKSMHRAISLLPYKEAKRRNAYFFIDRAVVKANQLPENVTEQEFVKEHWRAMLLQIPNITKDTANAILEEHPCPITLRKVLLRSPEPKISARNLIGEIVVVKRAGSIMENQRRVGPKMAQRICDILINDNPDHMLYED